MTATEVAMELEAQRKALKQPHRWAPVSLEWDAPDTPTTWRCPCGATCDDPTRRMLEECSRIALFEADDG